MMNAIYYNTVGFDDIFFASPRYHTIFLAGPTPRDKDIKSWRNDALNILKKNEYNGVIIIPEIDKKLYYGKNDMPNNIMDWENYYMTQCDVIVFWVPRKLENLPGFTTNVEFGRFCSDSRSLYGRPIGAPKTKYLDWMYMKFRNLKPYTDLYSLMIASMDHFNFRKK